MTQYIRQHVIFFIICLSIASIFLSITKGSVSLSLNQLLFSEDHQTTAFFYTLRLPRTLSAFIAGSLLALAGSMMQVLLQNPLADPYVLGTSSGAAFFTLVFMLFGFSSDWLIIGAWFGSLATMIIILLLIRKQEWQTHGLLLLGIAIASGFSAGIMGILLLSPNNNLHSMLFWLTGDLNNASYPWLALIILIISFIISFFLAPGLNVLGRGEKCAQSLGLSTKSYRITLFLLSSLCTSGAITIVGCIGFIGLIIPHISRFLVGYDHRLQLPISAILGGSFLTSADTISRTVFAPQQLPCGIIISMIGVPIFIWLIRK